MEDMPRRKRARARDGQTQRRGRDSRLSRAEEDCGGQQQTSRCKGRKRARETCVESVKDTKEERAQPNLKQGTGCEYGLGWKGPNSSQSSHPASGPSPSPACGGTRTSRKGEGEKITSWKDRAPGQTGQTGQESLGPKKVVEEDGEGQLPSCQRGGRKRGIIQSSAESRNDSKRGRVRPDAKRRRKAEEENDIEKKRKGSSSLSHAPGPSLATSDCSRTHNTASFSSLYTVGALLGEGGCGSVFAGMRRADGKQVAIKFVTNYCSKKLRIPGVSQPLPLEVALMEMVCRPPTCSHIIQLLEWFEEPDRIILVLELPSPCLDVSKFIKLLGGRLEENLAKFILRQVVQATAHCHDRGVLHRDIKSTNLLIQTHDLRVKLIDFGCGDLLQEDPYTRFAGTRLFQPPEWVMDGEYHGRPATIWSLGVLLFRMVCGSCPFSREQDIVGADLRFKEGLSPECKSLILWCLQRDPANRPNLVEILQHRWMAC